ncbi:MAG TPA: PD-(D/E)XK nuclease family protein [Pirellulales bacterium]|nr:PD-(D/E)XK nuclease family protein [Pirellulales bacterium]
MAPQRHFLGWDRPALWTASEWLFARHASASEADLGGLIVVLPGRRAGRRLLEILVQEAERRGLALAPPRIVTVGSLPELLYDPPAPPAGALAAELAWVAALRAVDPALLRRVVPEPPPQAEPPRWLSLAELLGRLHAELGGHALRFADVATCVRTIGDFGEDLRWEALADVQDRYLHTLAAWGLADEQAARLDAIQRRACRVDAEIVLLGAADVLPVARRMLEPLADRVTALVHAPEALAEKFDPFGCLVPAAWRDAPIELAEEQIHVVGGPADQAVAALRAIAAYGGRFSPEEIAVGVADPKLVPYLEQRFEQFGLPGRHADGLTLAQTGPYKLLAAVADYLDGGRYIDLAALVRHPDVEAWLSMKLAGAEGAVGDWIAELDRYYAQFLQSRLTGRWLGPPRTRRQLSHLRTTIDGEIRNPLAGERPLAEWAEKTVALLIEILGREQLDRNHPRERIVLEACERLHQVLVEAAALKGKVDDLWRGGDALRLFLRLVEGETIPPLQYEAAIEMLGWLELPLDDAPALIVTGFNDGVVPTSVGADQFLPGEVRRRLGLNDNERRYARDAYALAVLAASGRGLSLVAGRRSSEGDPLAPSRLLFACDQRTIARRTLRFFDRKPSIAESVVPPGLAAGQSRSLFAVPPPCPPAQPAESMRITEFRDYLACPYRYYLRHVLRLAALDDAAEELDPRAFGTLAHEALREFGSDPDCARLTDADAIRRRLDAALDTLVQERYGDERLSAVDVQIEQLRLRLGAFADWQARWASQGWRIAHAEFEVDGPAAPLIVDEKPMGLRARIDRVDLHEEQGYVIFDYKTSDKAKTPEQTHRKAQTRWIDLQLPLYRHLTPALGIPAEIKLGYIVLPKVLRDTREHLAEWDPDDLAAADLAAADVVRGVRRGHFYPPAMPPPDFAEEFARICGDGQFGGLSSDDEEESP